MTQRDEREKLLALNAWIEQNFTGHGVAIRRETDAPIPGEPLMSMAEAKELTRRAVHLFTPAPTDGEAHAEIQRLQDAKRRALAIADERAKENVALREALAVARKALEDIADGHGKHYHGKFARDNAWATLDRIAALANAPGVDPKAPWRCLNCGGNLAPVPASEGVRKETTEELRERAFKLSCHEQFRLATFVAENVGYVLAPEPRFQDEPADTPDEGPDPLGYAKGERA